MILSKHFFFKTSKYSNISTQIIEFKTLDNSEVLSSVFPGLRNLFSLIDLSGLCNLTGINSINSPISSINFLILMIWSSLAPKLTILVPFYGIGHQKSNFSLIFGTFSVGGCWGQPMLIFKNWLMKLKCPNLRMSKLPSSKI